MKQDHRRLPSLALYREIVEGCADAILVIDGDQTIRFLNKSAEAMFGRPNEEALGQSLEILLPEGFRKSHHKRVAHFAASAQAPRFMAHRDAPIFGLRKSGEIFPADVTILRTRDKEGLHLVAVVRDITESRQLEDRLRVLARTDSLTGILNRGAFEARAKEEVSRSIRFGQPLATVMMDIDHFKDINDRFGHALGDDALRSFVKLVSGQLRTCDVLGRWGGEEFALMLPSTTARAAFEVAERIRLAVKAAPFSMEEDGNPIHLSVSAGVTDLRDGDTVDTMLDRADQALYAAKSDGRNCVRQGATETTVPSAEQKLSSVSASSGRADRT